MLPEWIEPGLKAHRGWPDWRDALERIHADPADAKARERLAYDEVFANQLAMTLVRADTRKRRKGRALAGDGRLRDMLELPYTPTGAQSRTIREIEGDLAQEAPMLRLLQGDVGSGKTLVAAMALLIAVEAGAQGAMLAPTEILARQHYETLRKLLAGLPIEIAVLTGRDKGRVREATLMALAAGDDRHPDRHARDLPGAVGYRDLGTGGGRRAAPVRRGGADDAAGQGGPPAASARNDRDADPAHADAGAIWRDGRQPARRDAAGAPADRNAG